MFENQNLVLLNRGYSAAIA